MLASIEVSGPPTHLAVDSSEGRPIDYFLQRVVFIESLLRSSPGRCQDTQRGKQRAGLSHSQISVT